jgi:hypothetical protein
MIAIYVEGTDSDTCDALPDPADAQLGSLSRALVVTRCQVVARPDPEGRQSFSAARGERWVKVDFT